MLTQEEINTFKKVHSSELSALNALVGLINNNSPLPEGASTSANQINGTQKATIKFSEDQITKTASGALMVNNPFILFDGKTLNEDKPLLWQNTGTGTFTFQGNKMKMDVTSGQYCIRQSKRRIPYFSGYPLFIEKTFDFASLQTNVIKRDGYFSSNAVAPVTPAPALADKSNIIPFAGAVKFIKLILIRF